MTTSTVDHDLVIQAFARLRSSFSTTPLSPRQFVDADLDALADDGIFPENDFLCTFRKGTEKEILPIFKGDRDAFDEVAKLNFNLFAGRFELLADRHRFYLLGSRNMRFFVYCFCMVIRNGKGTNPYFGLNEAEERGLALAFRHLVEDFPVTTVGGGECEPSELTSVEIYTRLRYRWFVRPDGGLNRNKLKDAIVELGWIYRSDSCNDIAEKTVVVDAMPDDLRTAQGEAYLNVYMTNLLLQYLGISQASQDWYLERAFPLLEEFLSRCQPVKKQDRHEMRVRFTDILVTQSRVIGIPVEDLVFALARALAEPAGFRNLTGLSTMLENLYCATLACEFARDVCPVTWV